MPTNNKLDDTKLAMEGVKDKLVSSVKEQRGKKWQQFHFKCWDNTVLLKDICEWNTPKQLAHADTIEKGLMCIIKAQGWLEEGCLDGTLDELWVDICCGDNVGCLANVKAKDK
ncbi:uncharacterized protein ACA1_083770 [Acanthamoeba castellanii str. Neff]|uniref:Uncharacterized protein n=1 Tax=Acanthamoeba castellanii (strain ATCC 30010 / Neff) TaxID=1257118 RepID=L8GYL1_ACACF|nr:uncharacterized protein ACA1_083770 [Acanthamoeba castellanii str. Neff]ELR18037.1 hypothetical protein ACA1_083770 [Acanthamoeba castellanii str. Neff]